MDLNAYVLAMAIGPAPKHQRNRQTIPEPEFTQDFPVLYEPDKNREALIISGTF